jgi:hypothetical protein
MAQDRKEPLVITLSGERPAGEVAAELEAAGLTVGQILKEVGVITGSAPASAHARLRKVPGVADVSPDHAVDIGPPGSPIS